MEENETEKSSSSPQPPTQESPLPPQHSPQPSPPPQELSQPPSSSSPKESSSPPPPQQSPQPTPPPSQQSPQPTPPPPQQSSQPSPQSPKCSSQPRSPPSQSPSPPPKKRKISVNVKKVDNVGETIDIEGDALVKDFKSVISNTFGIEIDRLLLCYQGKSLIDENTLQMSGIGNDSTVYVAFRSHKPQGYSYLNNLNSTPVYGLGNLGGLGSLEGFGMGVPNFVELQSRMQTELANNPQMLPQLLDNPLVKLLMTNPESMKTLIQCSPQMKDLMDKKPEIAELLNNEEVLTQTTELARDPTVWRDLVRGQFRGYFPSENVESGYSFLEKIYRDTQEPMLSAASDQISNTSFATSQETVSKFDSRTEKIESDPPSASNLHAEKSDSVSSETAESNTAAKDSNLLSDSLNEPEKAERNQTIQVSSPKPSTSTAKFEETFEDPLKNNPDQLHSNYPESNIFQHFSENTELLKSMFSAPYTQAMFEALAANPNMASTILAQNPFLRDNQQKQEELRRMMTPFMNQLQNPQIREMLMNPQSMNTFSNIQKHVNSLQKACPKTMASITRGTCFPIFDIQKEEASIAAAASMSPPESNEAFHSNFQEETFSDFLIRMMSFVGKGKDGLLPPEHRYENELKKLETMGFSNLNANLKELIATFGDVDAAAERLLARKMQA